MTEFYLGCSVKQFSEHLERQFRDGMNWENYGNIKGKWSIDHIIPISSFNLDDIEQAKKAFHYSNCQPMWAIDNIKKGAKISAGAITFFASV